MLKERGQLQCAQLREAAVGFTCVHQGVRARQRRGGRLVEVCLWSKQGWLWVCWAVDCAGHRRLCPQA